MSTMSPTPSHRSAESPASGQRPTPPPLRLPRHLVEQLSRPIHTADDVDSLMAQIRLAEDRGLL